MEAEHIASKQFLVGVRGYVREEVHAFLRAVSDEVANRDRELAVLRAKVGDVDSTGRARVVEAAGQEIVAVLMAAEKAASEIRRNAIRSAKAVEKVVSEVDPSTLRSTAGRAEFVSKLHEAASQAAKAQRRGSAARTAQRRNT